MNADMKQRIRIGAVPMGYAAFGVVYALLRPEMPRHEVYLLKASLWACLAWMFPRLIAMAERANQERGVRHLPYRIFGWGVVLSFGGSAVGMLQLGIWGAPVRFDPSLAIAILGLPVMVFALLWAMPDEVRYYVRRWRQKHGGG